MSTSHSQLPIWGIFPRAIGRADVCRSNWWFEMGGEPGDLSRPVVPVAVLKDSQSIDFEWLPADMTWRRARRIPAHSFDGKVPFQLGGAPCETEDYFAGEYYAGKCPKTDRDSSVHQQGSSPADRIIVPADGSGSDEP
jgi:hypothetical protein